MSFCIPDRFNKLATLRSLSEGNQARQRTSPEVGGSDSSLGWLPRPQPDMHHVLLRPAVCTRGSNERVIVVSCVNCCNVYFLTAGSKDLCRRFGRKTLPPSLGWVAVIGRNVLHACQISINCGNNQNSQSPCSSEQTLFRNA